MSDRRATGEPSDLAADLSRLAREGKWKEIRGRMAPDFLDFEPQAIADALNTSRSLGPAVPRDLLDSENWTTERTPFGATSRGVGYPFAALTFEERNGTWVFNPGPYTLHLAEYYDAGAFGVNSFALKNRRVTGDVAPLDWLKLMSEDLVAMRATDDGFLVTIEWKYKTMTPADTVSVLLDQCDWSTDGQPPQTMKMLHTTGIWETDRVQIPMFFAYTTWLLPGAAKATEVGIKLTLQIGEKTLTLEHDLPVKTIPELPE